MLSVIFNSLISLSERPFSAVPPAKNIPATTHIPTRPLELDLDHDSPRILPFRKELYWVYKVLVGIYLL